jgi:hypothetical protein
MDQAASPRDVAKVFRTTDLLLAGGFVGGALFIVVSLAQALTRSGYEFSHHPLSLLSLGDMGWVQITNFVLAGVLFTGSAVGMRRVLARDRGGTWGPRLVGLFGVSLIAGGLFLPDPALAFPRVRLWVNPSNSVGTGSGTRSRPRSGSSRWSCPTSLLVATLDGSAKVDGR